MSASEAFTPTRPRAGRRTLVGRSAELGRILEALTDDSAHVVLYSERGRGKTSLSNLVVEQLRRRGAIVGRCACDADSTFDTIMRALTRDLPSSLLAVRSDDADAEGCESALPPRALRPADIGALPRNLSCPLIVFVVDEFDRVTDVDTRTRLADTIKLLSDRGLSLRFMIVGVSATLEQIIGQHPSIQRAVAGVHLPLLTDAEIATMLTRGGKQAGLDFDATAIDLVTEVAGGMPYMAQLLGLRITQAALARAGVDVTHGDLVAAVERLLADTSPSTSALYGSLTNGTPGMGAALRAVAGAERDEWSRISVARNGGHLLVGGSRIEAQCWRVLLDAAVIGQPEGATGLVHVQDRPLIYHVQLLAARDRLFCVDRQADKPHPLGNLAAAQ